MSTEVVSLAVVKELIATQERAFRQTVEMFATNMKEDINSIRKTVDDLKCSLNFSQRDIDDIKFKLYKAEEKVFNAEEAIFSTKRGIDELYDQQEYLENHSRRNNIKVLGIQESEGGETWEESEKLVKDAIKEHLKIEDDLLIERAHRVGKPRPPYRHVGGSKVASKPRPIVARFQIWKEKEKVIRAARKSKPDRVQFFEDFAKATLERRRQKVPELIKARKQGKKAFLVMDRVVYAKSRPPMKVNLLMSIINTAGAFI